MSIWYQGSGSVAADLKMIAADLQHYGEHCIGFLHHMPGITTAELVQDDGESVTIETNEGTMRRSHIETQNSGDAVIVECDEVYEAGTKAKVSAHYRHEFRPSKDGSEHRLIISNVVAPGFLGWMYRSFGARNMGKAFLKSYQDHYQDS